MRLAKAEVSVYRVPIEEPVRLSFGIMKDRPALIVRLEDGEGCYGWGEVWCNFPPHGAEHRANLMIASVLPVLSRLDTSAGPEDVWRRLNSALRTLAIQTGEPGPIAQCTAALECALRDLAARKAGLPLFKALSDRSEAAVRIYASGINPDQVARMVEKAKAKGILACKIKVGFNEKHDRDNLISARRILGERGVVLADANQAWGHDQAIRFLANVEEARLGWIEEPLPNDAPDETWRRLSSTVRVPLAAGENYLSLDEFERAPEARGIGILQPDLGKWGGVTGMVAVAQQAISRELPLCPHWLGGGVGLLTSLHVKAALQPDIGYVEVDANPNMVRDHLFDQSIRKLDGGMVYLTDRPGIGVEDGLVSQLKEYRRSISEYVLAGA